MLSVMLLALAMLISGSLLTDSAVAAASGSTFPILVMGDSYSAGNGAGDYQGPKGCWQSSRNYASLYAQALNQPPYDQLAYVATSACSGDKTSSFFSTTSGRPPQLDAVNKTFGLIFLTIGGDDVNFVAIVKNCLVQKARDGEHCNSDLSAAEKLLNDGTLEARIQHVLGAIRQKANPQATIALLGYPYLESDVHYRLPYGHNQSVAVGARLRALEDKGDRAVTPTPWSTASTADAASASILLSSIAA